MTEFETGFNNRKNLFFNSCITLLCFSEGARVKVDWIFGVVEDLENYSYNLIIRGVGIKLEWFGKIRIMLYNLTSNKVLELSEGLLVFWEAFECGLCRR